MKKLLTVLILFVIFVLIFSPVSAKPNQYITPNPNIIRFDSLYMIVEWNYVPQNRQYYNCVINMVDEEHDGEASVLLDHLYFAEYHDDWTLTFWLGTETPQYLVGHKWYIWHQTSYCDAHSSQGGVLRYPIDSYYLFDLYLHTFIPLAIKGWSGGWQ